MLLLMRGDALALPLAGESIDAIVTDPPYGLAFMGKDWDRYSDRDFERWCEQWAREALRVLKPGGHLLAFGGTRTFHRLTCGLEDAGFEIRDVLSWLYGSGFPKSLDVSKAIDKAERGVPQGGADPTSPNHGRYRTQATEGRRSEGDAGRGYGAGPGQFMREQGERGQHSLSPDALAWEGWGTALKPAWEPCVLARKPLRGTVAQNVLAHGTGALNIDGCRIAHADPDRKRLTFDSPPGMYQPGARSGERGAGPAPEGRWPANVMLDEEAAALLDQQAGESIDGVAVRRNGVRGGEIGPPGAKPIGTPDSGYGGAGGPSRFFKVAKWTTEPATRFHYDAKASRSEREAGLDDLDHARRVDSESRQDGAPGSDNPRLRTSARRNDHPTVKPVDLMRWLVRLMTPPGGVVLDPFMGSGTTGMAAVDEGFSFIGLEREERYVEIARRRIAHRHVLRPETRDPAEAQAQGRLF